MRKMTQSTKWGLMHIDILAIASAFAFKALAFLSWVVAVFAIMPASVILLRQPYR